MKKLECSFSLISVIFILLLSCKNEQESTVIPRIDVLSETNKPMEFESVKMVPLETMDDNLLGGRIKIKTDDLGNIYIADFINGKCIYIYNSEGTYLRKVGKHGKGAGEYIHLHDFCVLNDTIEILSGEGKESVINAYSVTGNLLYSKKFNIVSSSFEHVGNSYFFYTSYNKGVHDYRIYQVDKNGDIIEAYLYNDTKLNLPVNEENFFKYDNQLYVKDAFDPLVYVVNQNKITPHLELNFGEYNIPKDFYNKTMMEGFDMLNKNGFGNVVRYCENRDYSVFEIGLQEEGNKGIMINAFYDKKSKSCYINTDFCLNRLVGITGNDEVIFVAYPDQVFENLDAFKQLPIEDKTEFSKLTQLDNPLLFYCKVNL